MAIPKITGSGPNSRTNLKNIHSGERSFQKDLSTTHSQIALMQRALSSLGYDTQGTDGIFGNNTESAVKSFQRSRGLTVDGYFGKNSLLALEGLLDYHLDSGDGGCDGISPTIFIGSAVITTLSGVRFRKTPGGNVIKKVDKGVIMTVTEIVESDQYKWYKGIISNDAGYLREDCIAKYTGSPNDTVSDSMDFSDIVTITPKVTTYYNFSIPNAVKYALEHSTSTKENVVDPKRNTSFHETAKDACANFIHQCLLAGGARMFDGWSYKLPGIPSSWEENKAWVTTNQGRRKLLEKGWIYRIKYEDVRIGDIIYTYNKKAKPTPFKHVTIAVGNYDPTTKECKVCGHTKNQHSEPKYLAPQPKTGNETYCYRVVRQLGGDSTEKAIDLTNGKSKAI